MYVRLDVRRRQMYWDALSESENVEFEDLLIVFDQYLAEFVYDKIWSELTPKEKEAKLHLEKTYKVVDMLNMAKTRVARRKKEEKQKDDDDREK